MSRWTGYYEAVKGKPPRETAIRALDAWHAEFGDDRTGIAVDLASGEGRDTVAFLARGWRTIAVDSEPTSFDWLKAREDLPENAALETICAPMEDAVWPGADIVNASFALPFIRPAAFPAFWRKLVDNLNSGGRFSGQFFGPNDSWADQGLSIFSRPELDRLLDSFDIDWIEEIDRDGRDAKGFEKHWHLFNVVARRR